MSAMGSEKSAEEVVFARGEADRRIAGVAAAARVARDLDQRGIARLVLGVPEGALAEATLADMRRLAPGLAVHIVDRPGADSRPAPRLDEGEILRATEKAGDGPISHHFNRPVSRFISARLLRFPGMLPLHATIGTAALAAAMFAALAFGGPVGLIAGGLLFHCASVFDGVDGEMARATFRTSRAGATLDSAVDVATNLAFITGVTINLSARSSLAVPVGAWGLLLFLLGLAAISRTAARADRPFSLEVLKQRYRARFRGSAFHRLMRFLTVVSSRDFFAFLFAVLIIAGRPMAVLTIFAGAASLWILFVVGALIVPAPATAMKGSA